MGIERRSAGDYFRDVTLGSGLNPPRRLVMSSNSSQPSALLAEFKQYVVRARYGSSTVAAYVAVAEHFLAYLARRKVPIQGVSTEHVSAFLDRELVRFSRRHGHGPACVGDWRSQHSSGIRQLLWWANGRLPMAAAPRCPFEAFSQALCDEYAQWLDEQRGLAAATIHGLIGEARRFLVWYGQGRTTDSLWALAIADIDAYVQTRAALLERVSLKSVTHQLRSVLRFAHATGRTGRDFALSVMSPTLYALESIPSCLDAEEIRCVAQATRSDHSPKGLRDYAILLLLSTYGLRAGEIARLQLQDIDWRADRIRVLHTKTATRSLLPLLATVGDALLAYLRRGRPVTDACEIFIRTCAPYRGFADGSSLYSVVRGRLDAAGVQPVGKRGPHAFRHARAVSLLRAGVSQKIIGDVLGHRSAASTTPYLKLATEELRNVALEIPMCSAEVQP
jgi:site-specific recombinase XerD